MRVVIYRFIVIKTSKDHKLVQLSKTFSKEELFCIPRVGDTWEEKFILDKATIVEQVAFNYEKGLCKVFLQNLQFNENSFNEKIFNLSIKELKNKGWQLDNIEPTLEMLLK